MHCKKKFQWMIGNQFCSCRSVLFLKWNFAQAIYCPTFEPWQFVVFIRILIFVFSLIYFMTFLTTKAPNSLGLLIFIFHPIDSQNL